MGLNYFMAKIVFLVHEHPEETPMTRHRATQLKKFLEKEHGHEVEITTLRNPVSGHEIARRIYTAKNQEAAFKVLESFLQKVDQVYRDSLVILLKEARSRPDSHVVSMHAVESPTHLIKAASCFVMGKEFFDKYFVDRIKHLAKEHSSIIVPLCISRKGKLAAIVENAASYEVYRKKGGVPGITRMRKCLDYIDAWFEAKKRSGESNALVSDAVKEWTDQIAGRTFKRAVGRRDENVSGVEHARALAEKISELVASAEKGEKIAWF